MKTREDIMLGSWRARIIIAKVYKDLGYPELSSVQLQRIKKEIKLYWKDKDKTLIFEFKKAA